jgi:predicted CoA-binding protein
MAIDGLTNNDIKHIRDQVKTIAVVGLSPKPHRASHQVALYLQQQGYHIIPGAPSASDHLRFNLLPKPCRHSHACGYGGLFSCQ